MTMGRLKEAAAGGANSCDVDVGRGVDGCPSRTAWR
jgi:hypothetical protein